ncbi:MAG: 6-phosphofructokinase [Deltaproteobacteria bacterium]|nr:6-phosphofructokinase [Deltaproteobacteria bacterium]
MNDLKRVAIVFSGGPAPAANAVIAAAATSFLETGVEVLGIFHGYTNLQEYDAAKQPMIENEHYRLLTPRDIRGLRNTRGVIIGTARVNPGAGIEAPADLLDPEKTERLARIHHALADLGVDALISIGGDDTLKTANFLYEYQGHQVADKGRIRVVHLPKTIDNDYRGIDFTFGFFTAVDVMAKELLNLRADCIATSSYFIVETMGRKAGWLSYGVAIAGEANMVLSTEDVEGDLAIEEKTTDPHTGEEVVCRRLSITALVDRIVDLMLAREKRDQYYGTVVLAEGLAELLPENSVAGLPRDEHGHIWLSAFDLAKMVSDRVQTRYEERTGQRKKVRHIQLGYESRCSPPHAFDVMLASQLGIGAFRALVEEELDGYMVSVSGQLDLQYVEFSKLVNPQTLQTDVRFIESGSDFHRLARFLETRTELRAEWSPGRRLEPESEKPPSV